MSTLDPVNALATVITRLGINPRKAEEFGIILAQSGAEVLRTHVRSAEQQGFVEVLILLASIHTEGPEYLVDDALLTIRQK